VAALIRAVGDWDLAEEAVQDAFATAAERWPREGVPRDPAAWVIAVARNRAIDRLRRERALRARAPQLAAQIADREEPTLE
jgi:RNA polymerase sigma-70 factor (ECF subfamily)